MMSDDGTFTVAIYANEYKQICAWVLKNQTLETGGDLFGLWASDHCAVVQLVLGPGRNCQRASHSFYQDVQYLEKVGSDLTGKEGLCHIGEWHSHHTIGLKRPSGGDEGTVWRNMPTYGLSRFLLFIANIKPWSQVSVGCFLFEFKKGTQQKLPVLQGKFHLLPDESPFRSKCLSVVREGSEWINSAEVIASLEQIQSDAGKKSAPSNAAKESAMRPLMQSRRKRQRPRTPENEGEPATANENGREDEVHNDRRHDPAKEIRKRCPICAVL